MNARSRNLVTGALVLFLAALVAAAVLDLAAVATFLLGLLLAAVAFLVWDTRRVAGTVAAKQRQLAGLHREVRATATEVQQLKRTTRKQLEGVATSADVAALTRQVRRLQAAPAAASPAKVPAKAAAKPAASGETRRVPMLVQPSFIAKLASLKRTDAQAGRLRSAHPVWRINHKLTAYSFANRLGVETPELFGRWASIDEVDWNALPDSFVFKSVTGAASRAVYPLRRTDTGFIDLFTDEHMSIPGVVKRFKDLQSDGQASAEVFAEELLGSGQWPVDVKFYCFYGEVGLVLVRDCRGKRATRLAAVKYTDPDGTFLPNAMADHRVDPAVPVPDNFLDLRKAAERISLAIPRPFARIDMFDRGGVPVLGEVTPCPGGDQPLNPQLDAKLGAMWEAAEARLQGRIVKSGALDLA